MSLQFRIADQVLKVADKRDLVEAALHKYDAFLNLLCADRYAWRRLPARSHMRNRRSAVSESRTSTS